MSEQAMKNTGSTRFLTEKIKPLYFKYLTAAFGSALISSIYGVVDMAMVGQYEGPNGTAALAVVSPIWNIIYSLGLLMGIGGSVLFSTLRGESEQNRKKSNQYFTASLIGTAILAVITWLAVIFFDRELLILFGAEETLLPLARRYLFPVKFAVPSFLFTQLMAAFLRNDGNPALATKAVLFGGVFNVFGDWFFVFALDLGVMGAGLATVMGSLFSLLIMLTHFFSKRNTLRLERPTKLFSMLKSIGVTGFSTFFIDVAMGILTMLFNRQILRYLGTDALSVYGIIINIGTFVQCCAYSIGQASQPMISTNFGAHQGKRIREILKYALATAAVSGLAWTALAEFTPNLFVRIFMTPTDGILKIAPATIRSYGISFLLLPLNIFSTYYFQALMKPSISFIVSVSRGAVISGILIYLLPLICGADSLWLAMPITELLVAIFVAVMMTRYTKRL
ncbi:MAG: MATE family efflux transporter [Eubacteriales bacterium]